MRGDAVKNENSAREVGGDEEAWRSLDERGAKDVNDSKDNEDEVETLSGGGEGAVERFGKILAAILGKDNAGESEYDESVIEKIEQEAAKCGLKGKEKSAAEAEGAGAARPRVGDGHLQTALRW